MPDMPIQVPCGQCGGCRTRRAREWSLRMMHEASLHSSNLFLTLTYNNQNLPKDRSLNLTHFQLFITRLRKKYGNGIRFYHCGEYGPKTLRPHYHAIIFNLELPDLLLYSNKNDQPLFTSEILDKIWSHGECKIGWVTISTARYVAGYIQKKITGERALRHYSRETLDNETGEVLAEWQVKPEYATMSRRPGIGIGWFQKFQNDCYPSDFLTSKGAKFPVPRSYDRQMEESVHAEYRKEILKVKDKRKRRANTAMAKSEQTSARLKVKAFLAKREDDKHERDQHEN